MRFFLKGRILNRVRLFLFAAFAFSPSYAADPVTAEGRLNRGAYPLVRYGEKYTALPKGVEAELRSRIAQVLQPIRLAPASWFRATLGQVPSSGDRRKILESFAETEIWKCQGRSCDGCLGDQGTGCVLGKSLAGGAGVVALIHPCVYGEGKCLGRGAPDPNEWSEKAVVGVAYYKSGLAKNDLAMKKAMKNSSAWLQETSRSVNLMLGACPGPYSTDSLKFLFELDSVTLPNSAILRCGQTYLEEIRTLPTKCKSLTNTLKDEWAAYEKKQLRGSADVLRCDPYCLKMLCRQKNAGTVFTRFSDKPALLIGDGGCEGETPKMRGRFLREALPRDLRGKLEASGCLPDEEKSATRGGATSEIGNGPEVQLVE